MRFLLLLLAAVPSRAAVLPVRLEAVPAASAAVFAVAAPGLSASPSFLVPALGPAAAPAAAAPAALQPPVSAPLPADAPGLSRIAAVGDAGTADEHQGKIARAMSAEHDRAPFASVLALGDNVYENGEPEKFDAAIRDPYAALFDGGVRFFPVLGNHDVRSGRGEAQLAYWGAPRWYKASIGAVDAFAIDTTILIPRYQKHAYDGSRTRTEAQAREMLAWLDAELSRTKAAHVVVFGHHPLYVSTNEEQKVEEAARLREILEPLLKKHGVKLYLSGHKHHYERSRPVDGVTHLISGAGGQLSDKPSTYPSGVSAVEIKKRHFLTLEADGEVLRVRALNKRGEVLDEFVLR